MCNLVELIVKSEFDFKYNNVGGLVALVFSRKKYNENPCIVSSAAS